MSTPNQAIAQSVSRGHFGHMLSERISKNIWRVREAKGVGRRELGSRMSPRTSGQQIERLEKGERRLTVEWIERIANGLKVDPAELLMGEDQRFDLTEQVANEVAAGLARFVLRGDEPDQATAEALSILIQDLTATFAEVPEARHDPQVVRPLIRALSRRFDRRT